MRPVAVDALIYDGVRILMVKRAIDPYKGFWALPGGHIEDNETAEQAVLREVKEETGLDVRILSLIGVFSDPGRDPRQTISIAFLLEPVGDREVVLNFEASEYDWFTLDNLPSNIGFDHKLIIEKAQEIMFK